MADHMLAIRGSGLALVSLPHDVKSTPVEESDTVIAHHEHAMIRFLEPSGVTRVVRRFFTQQNISGLEIEQGKASRSLPKNDTFTVHKDVCAKRDPHICVAV